jgi:hypothetical protein
MRVLIVVRAPQKSQDVTKRSRDNVSAWVGRKPLRQSSPDGFISQATLVQIRISICERKEAEHLLA